MAYDRYKDEDKLFDEIYKYQYPCAVCGRKVVIFPYEHKVKKVCSWCGTNVYISPEEEKKDRFKSELRKKMREL